MLIDVQDPALNPILNVCFFSLLGVACLSAIPWRLRGGRNRWTLFLPLMGIAIYVLYEIAMPNRWDIRIDLLLLWPALLFIFVLGTVRGALILLDRRQEARPKNGS